MKRVPRARLELARRLSATQGILSPEAAFLTYPQGNLKISPTTYPPSGYFFNQ